MNEKESLKISAKYAVTFIIQKLNYHLLEKRNPSMKLNVKKGNTF